MCSTCGCNQPGETITIKKAGEVIFTPLAGNASLLRADHHHHHQDHDGHDHHHHPVDQQLIELEKDILGKNDLAAARNRGYFEARDICSLNMVSSPGSGKTTLLERTLTDLAGDIQFSVIEGDQQSMNDAERIAATGFPAVQVNTGKACHLDADMVHAAVRKLDPRQGSVLIIENVGNLVCPSMFDLGESARVVIMSVTEGDDKPVKYPDMFHTSDLCIISKTDLLPYVPFDMEKARENASQVNHRLEFLEVSALTGEGMESWYDWLKAKLNFREESGITNTQAL
jgi:hydrogenase nickel incorporation protein HypB